VTVSKRFFSDQAITGRLVQLTGQECQHLVHVMRAREGDTVTLFDGSGAEFPARVLRISRSAVELEVLARQERNRELGVELTLGVALPKGDRQHWLVEKAVELGVTRVVPLITERGVAQPVDRTLARLRRSVVEAAKQCGRNRLMEIAAPLPIADFCARAPLGGLRVLAHLTDAAVPVWTLRLAVATVHLAVGPEGGFTDEEVAAANGWQVVRLGPRILRVETAALALAAYFALAGEPGASMATSTPGP
jgi:16S rRNA (uracil1498-N3)-methyltransferase